MNSVWAGKVQKATFSEMYRIDFCVYRIVYYRSHAHTAPCALTLLGPPGVQFVKSIASSKREISVFFLSLTIFITANALLGPPCPEHLATVLHGNFQDK